MLILILSVDTVFYIYPELKDFIALFIGINLTLFMIFLLVNRFFELEYTISNNDFKKLNNSVLNGSSNNIKKILLRKSFFKENNESYKIFKNMYIKKNLIAKDYEDLKKVFLKFIPETFLNEIGEKGAEKISLGITVKKYLYVMFLDIIGFTSIAEKLSPDRALLLLNVYFDGIVEIVKLNGGYIDKFLGDGIMIVFELDSSDNIIKSSIEIQKFMDKFKFSDIGKKVSVGIGINSGEVILGTIGSNKCL